MRAALLAAALLALLALAAAELAATDAASSDGAYDGATLVVDDLRSGVHQPRDAAVTARIVDAPPMPAPAASGAAPGASGLEVRSPRVNMIAHRSPARRC